MGSYRDDAATNSEPPTTPADSGAALPLSRKVALGDAELLHAVQWAHSHFEHAERVEFRSTRHRRHTVRKGSGWKWKCDKRSFSIYARQTVDEDEWPVDGAPQSRSAREWLAAGEIACPVPDLARWAATTNENDFNTLMKGLYDASFIYGSVVYTADVDDAQPSTEAVDQATVEGQANAEGQAAPSSTSAAHQTGPLVVKTCSFVRSQLFARKNDQLCYVERFRRTATGFQLAMCSLPASRLSAGTASSELVDEVHPFAMWVSVEPTPSTTGESRTARVVFHSSFRPLMASQSKATRIAMARMLEYVKGIGRLESQIVGKRRGRQASMSVVAPSGHHNGNCIVCTRNLFALFHAAAWRRCDLCAYNVCERCCSLQRLASHSRHTPPMRVCLRCCESLEYHEYSSAVRSHTPRPQQEMATAAVATTPQGERRLSQRQLVFYESNVVEDPPGQFSL